jgi:hypothetical protein
MKQTIALLLTLMWFAAGQVSWAQSSAPAESSLERATYTAGSVLGSILYTPFKGLLCVMGGTGSGLVFISSGSEGAKAVARESCTGTWFITPSVLKGDEPLNFVGPLEFPAP